MYGWKVSSPVAKGLAMPEALSQPGLMVSAAPKPLLPTCSNFAKILFARRALLGHNHPTLLNPKEGFRPLEAPKRGTAIMQGGRSCVFMLFILWRRE